MKKTPAVYVGMSEGMTDQIRSFMVAYCFWKKHPEYKFILDLSKFKNRDKELKKQQKNKNYKPLSNFGHIVFSLDYFKIKEHMPYTTTTVSPLKIFWLKITKRYSAGWKNSYDVVNWLKRGVKKDVYIFHKSYSTQIENIPMCFSEISDMFELSAPPPTASNALFIKKIQSSACPVCMHVRRGDAWAGYKNAEYLYEKINQLKKQLKNIKLDIFVFSNDLKWCEENLKNFKGVKFTFVDANSESEPYFELDLMKRCKHFILTSGQFGKLAYVLCKNTDKKIVSDLILP
ncbi:MAG: alpha-1,2-fucosyltransferase [Mycoplasmataceae bacterium]|jgi:hypothetical protein|nr:alpha-1,2-fucosyltransferase [Mycoplasmataceae bacterium]